MLSIPSFSMGFVAGFGTGFISREVMAAGTAILRPITKAVVKSSMLAFEKSRETLAHFTETLEDLVAEARSEVEEPVKVAKGGGESIEIAAMEIETPVSESPSHHKGKEKSKSHGKKEHG